jgi:hypothetical protein
LGGASGRLVFPKKCGFAASALLLLEPKEDGDLLLAALHNLLWCATELGYVAVVLVARQALRELERQPR